MFRRCISGANRILFNNKSIIQPVNKRQFSGLSRMSEYVFSKDMPGLSQIGRRCIQMTCPMIEQVRQKPGTGLVYIIAGGTLLYLSCNIFTREFWWNCQIEWELLKNCGTRASDLVQKKVDDNLGFYAYIPINDKPDIREQFVQVYIPYESITDMAMYAVKGGDLEKQAFHTDRALALNRSYYGGFNECEAMTGEHLRTMRWIRPVDKPIEFYLTERAARFGVLKHTQDKLKAAKKKVCEVRMQMRDAERNVKIAEANVFSIEYKLKNMRHSMSPSSTLGENKSNDLNATNTNIESNAVNSAQARRDEEMFVLVSAVMFVVPAVLFIKWC